MALFSVYVAANSEAGIRLAWRATINYELTNKREEREGYRKDRKKMGDLYALDFDGVICDSCGETAISAVKVFLSLFLVFFSSSQFKIDFKIALFLQ